METRTSIPFSVENPNLDLSQSLTKSPSSRVSQENQPPLWVKGLAWIIMQPWRVAITLCLLDIIAIFMSIVAAFLVRSYFSKHGYSFEFYIAPLLWYIILFCTIFVLRGGYDKISGKRPEDELRDIVLSNIYAFLLELTTIFIFYKYAQISRLIIILGFIFSTLLLVTFHFGLRGLTKKLWAFGLARENVIIIGNSLKNINWVLEHLNIQRHLGVNILGYVAAHPLESLKAGLKYLGRFDDLSRIKELIRIDKVFFAMQYDKERHQTLVRRLEKCAQLKIPALIISQIFNHFNFSLILDGYTGVFEVNRSDPGYANSKPMFRLLKRSIDILGSLSILIASFPIWLIIIICIKLDDGGPIFFRHRRVGKDGKPLYMIKFRTMVTNAEEILRNNPELFQEFYKTYKLENDPRITRVGKWLRKISLDELPQIINILKGDMSLVGPRPREEEELERYGELRNEIIKMKPGLTGFWQVSGRSSTSHEEKILMDKFYLYKCSIWLDLVILLRTPYTVIVGHGAE